DAPHRPDYKRRASGRLVACGPLKTQGCPRWRQCGTRFHMANTKSAKKAARKIARRTIVNQSRRSRMRNYVRKVEEAIAAGDRNPARAVMKEAEPQIMRAAQKGVLHKNSASRKVSRLVARIAKLGA